MFNRVSSELIPWARVKIKKEESGGTLFAIKNEVSKCVMLPRKALSDKKEVIGFCGQFPQFTSNIEESFVNFWPKEFCTLSEFNQDDLDISRFPLDNGDMIRTFRNVGTGSSLRLPKLHPPVLTFLGFHSELIGCLPPRQFSADVVAGSFGFQAKDIVSLSSVLLSEEHSARMHLLAMTVIFTSVQVFCALAKNSVAPSALEAAGFSLFSGIAPFVSFAWIQSYARFCKARVALRRSVFVEPVHRLATQVIVEDPFSRDLFSSGAIERAAKDFYKDYLKWESLLKMKVEYKNRPKSRPARRPAYRPYHPYRRGSYSNFRGARQQYQNNRSNDKPRQPFFRRGGYRGPSRKHN